jgi:hypothetical protein
MGHLSKAIPLSSDILKLFNKSNALCMRSLDLNVRLNTELAYFNSLCDESERLFEYVQWIRTRGRFVLSVWDLRINSKNLKQGVYQRDVNNRSKK